MEKKKKKRRAHFSIPPYNNVHVGVIHTSTKRKNINIQFLNIFHSCNAKICYNFHCCNLPYLFLYLHLF